MKKVNWTGVVMMVFTIAGAVFGFIENNKNESMLEEMREIRENLDLGEVE